MHLARFLLLSPDSSFISMVFYGIGGAFLYFLPSLTARSRNARHETGIVLLNFFLGWTVLGWLLAMTWAVSTDPNARFTSTNVRQTENPPR